MNKPKKLQFSRIFNIYITKKFSINIWVVPTFIFSAAGGYADMFFLAYATALFHELSHVFTAKLMKVSVSEVRIYPFGVNAKLSRSYIQSSEKEFLIAFAGPLSNLLLFWMVMIIKSFTDSELLSYCADLNLAMCAVNLVPALPLDGGRMLKSMLTSKYGIIRSYNFMLKLSRGIVIVLMTASVIFFFVSSFNFSLILISAFLLQNLCTEQQALSVIALKEILNSSNKFSSNTEYPTKIICVSGNMPARRILKFLSYDYCYVVHITDSESKIIKTVTESQVLTALTKHGLRTLYRDV